VVVKLKSSLSLVAAQPCPPAVCTPAPDTPKRQRGHGGARPLPVTLSLNEPWRVRVGHMLTLLEITDNTFYARKKAGLIPPQDGFDTAPFWLSSTVREYLSKV
jgi:hypothetical protein